MRHASIRHLFLDQFDVLYAPLRLTDASEKNGALTITVDANGQAFTFRCVEVNRGTPDLLRAQYQRARRDLSHVSQAGEGADCEDAEGESAKTEDAEGRGAGSESDELVALVAPHTSPYARSICQALGVSLFDLSGNVAICSAGMRVQQAGGRTKARLPQDLDLFAGKAARIPLILLTEPARIWTVRTLAQEARTSIGLTSQVLQALAGQGYLDTKMGQGRGGVRLHSPQRLLDDWCAQYTPNVTAITRLFSLGEPDVVQTRIADYCRETGQRYAFSGTSATAAPQMAVTRRQVLLYVEMSVPQVHKLASEIGLLRLADTPNSVVILHARDEFCCYKARETAYGFVTSPLQTYLDLVAFSAQQQASVFRDAFLDF